ncbi:DUF4493 domain-containing protein [Parabacteroides sp.]
MRRKVTYWGMACLLGGCLSLSSCQQEELGGVPVAKGTGTIQLDLTADAGFSSGSKTKAVDEDAYKNLNQYTVQILDMNNNLKKEFTYSANPEPVTLDNGSYLVKAFYKGGGVTADTKSSRAGFYVEGSSIANVEGEDTSVSFTCAPVCGKVKTAFDGKMANYFEDYYVEYKTSSATVRWEKADTDPWYLWLPSGGETVTATIHLTAKKEYEPAGDAKEGTVVKTYKLLRNKSWTLSVAPNYSSSFGQLGIQIKIDETTVDHEIPIEIPTEWINATENEDSKS